MSEHTCGGVNLMRWSVVKLGAFTHSLKLQSSRTVNGPAARRRDDVPMEMSSQSCMTTSGTPWMKLRTTMEPSARVEIVEPLLLKITVIVSLTSTKSSLLPLPLTVARARFASFVETAEGLLPRNSRTFFAFFCAKSFASSRFSTFSGFLMITGFELMKF